MIKILKWLPVQKNIHPQGVILARVHREWKSWFLEIALFASIYTPYIPMQIKFKKAENHFIRWTYLFYFYDNHDVYMVSIFLLTYALNNTFHRKARNPRTLSLYMTRLNPAIIFLNKDWCQTIHNSTWYPYTGWDLGSFYSMVQHYWCSAFLIQYVYTVCFENYVLQNNGLC